MSERKSARDKAGTPPRASADRTPVSSSGVVARGTSPSSRSRRSEPPLTPYQARMDVEMDDTAISKVRDPSVSISLSAEGLLPFTAPPQPRRRSDALYSIALGTLLGAAIVVLGVLALRLFSR